MALEEGTLKARGFTLVEVLVVVAVIAVIVGLTLPMVVRSRRVASAVDCRSHLRAIGQAIAAYAADNRGAVIPWQADGQRRRRWRELIFKGDGGGVLVCPTADPVSEDQSYPLNLWIQVAGIRLEGRNGSGISASSIVLAGENRPNVNYEYLPIVDERT